MEFFGKVIVIGGTGMLADACRVIAKQSIELVLVARSPEPLAKEIGAKPLSMDWNNKQSIERTIRLLKEEGVYDLLVSWVHDSGLDCIKEFESLLAPKTRSIRVYGSDAGDPCNGIKNDFAARAGIIRQNVVLGWVNEGNGRRWLSNQEISQGVINAFENPAQPNYIVGTLSKF